jgi:hypothetical protein
VGTENRGIAISKGKKLMKIKAVFFLSKIPTIIHFQLVNITLIVELIMVGVLNSTFPRFN